MVLHRHVPRISAVVVCLCLIAGKSFGQNNADREARIAWLKAHTVPIQSIDPTKQADDFADLEPLRKAIGDSRVVILGEQSHDVGATFLAKGRLIKFLHQRMGFDVLAWEAGLFNVYDMDAAMRDTTVPLDQAISRGLYPIWATSAQVKPVFEYVRSVAATRRPIELAGFDHQFSGAGPSRWVTAITEFIDRADTLILPRELRSTLRSDVRAMFSADAKPADIRAIAKRWKGIATAFDANRAVLEKKHGSRDVALFRRSIDAALVSVEGIARMRESGGQFVAADNNLRDQWMGETVAWLANERYKDRKIIIWVASFHALRDPTAITLGPDAGFSYQGLVTMGKVAHSILGKKIFSIGFTSAEGAAGTVTDNEPRRLASPSRGSLEDLLTATGRQFLFLNLRKLPRAHWLRAPIEANALSNSAIETDWTRQFDAIVFIRTMFPSTTGPLAPEGAMLTVPSSR